MERVRQPDGTHASSPCCTRRHSHKTSHHMPTVPPSSLSPTGAKENCAPFNSVLPQTRARPSNLPSQPSDPQPPPPPQSTTLIQHSSRHTSSVTANVPPKMFFRVYLPAKTGGGDAIARVRHGRKKKRSQTRTTSRRV